MKYNGNICSKELKALQTDHIPPTGTCSRFEPLLKRANASNVRKYAFVYTTNGLLSSGDHKTSLPLSLTHTPACKKYYCRTTVFMSRMWIVAVVSAVYQRAEP